MKKALFLTLLTIVSLSGFSQDRKDFFKFAINFNWSMSEADFKVLYANSIVPETDTLFISMDIQKGTYMLNDLKIDDYDCFTFVTFSQEEPPSILACLTDDVLQTNNTSVLSLKLDHIVEQKFKEPDLSFDDMPLSSFGFSGMDDVTGRLRIWMTDTLTFATVRSIIEDDLTYLFVARKGELREPDFRKGRWGDSMSQCLTNEGRRDEYGMEDIYAFETFVGGLKAIAAYRFTDDRLTSGKYIFTEENVDNCIRDYDRLVYYLTQKYGEPDKVNKDYLASDYERRLFSDGELIRDSKLKMGTVWYTPFSFIVIFLHGEKHSISMGLEYYSSKLEQLREEDILNDL